MQRWNSSALSNPLNLARHMRRQLPKSPQSEDELHCTTKSCYRLISPTHWKKISWGQGHDRDEIRSQPQVCKTKELSWDPCNFCSSPWNSCFSSSQKPKVGSFHHPANRPLSAWLSPAGAPPRRQRFEEHRLRPKGRNRHSPEGQEMLDNIGMYAILSVYCGRFRVKNCVSKLLWLVHADGLLACRHTCLHLLCCLESKLTGARFLGVRLCT